jgi:serine/threonine-protein kinase
MERRTGGTVASALARGPVEPVRALRWLRETADALDAAHDRGVVHRDIKPGNLLLDEHDRVAVADFGIARLAYESDQVTQTGQVLGTAAYISPEQAAGEPATDASDRYALAVVAFELLTGRKPFQADHFAAQARAHIEDPVPRASQLADGLPPAVDDVLARGMAKEPADRWPSAGAFVDALEGALAGEATGPTRAMPSRTVVAAAPVAADEGRFTGGPGGPRTPVPPPTGPPRRRVPAAALAAIAFLLLAAIAAAAIISGGGNDGSGAANTPTPTPTKHHRHKAKQTPTPTPTATATATATSTPTATPGPSGSVSALNDKGYSLLQAGQASQAVPYLRKAVQECGSSLSLTCAYATYNYGAALNRAGDPSAAIPVLQRRLSRWPDNQPDVVRRELAAACSAAGQDCGGSTGGAPAPGPKKPPGKAKGHGKGD